MQLYDNITNDTSVLQSRVFSCSVTVAPWEVSVGPLEANTKEAVVAVGKEYRLV